MVTALQIILLLVLISLIGILIGYIFGKLYCKKEFNNKIIQKGKICEEEYNKNLLEEENLPDSKQSLINDVNSSDNIKKNEELDNLKTTGIENKSEAIQQDSTLSNKDIDNLDSQDNSSSKDINTINEELASNNSNNKPLKEEAKTKVKENIQQLEDKNIEVDKTKSLIPTETSEDNSGTKPLKLLNEPKDGKADNLCKIKGIGVVIEEKLNKLGVYHFEQIASWSEKEIAWVDEHLSFKGRILREDWIGQAKLLAKGEETEFSKRVEKGEVESSKKS